MVGGLIGVWGVAAVVREGCVSGEKRKIKLKLSFRETILQRHFLGGSKREDAMDTPYDGQE